MKAFEAIDEILRNALKGIVEIIAMPGIINVDFADVKTLCKMLASQSSAWGWAPDRNAQQMPCNLALHSPLLETTAEGAKAILLGISGSRDLKMTEVNDIAKIVAETADRDARIIFGAYHDRNLKPNQIKVTIVATGLNGNGTGNGALFAPGHYGPERGAMFTRATPSPTTPASGMTSPASLSSSINSTNSTGAAKKNPTSAAPEMLLKKDPTKETPEEKNMFDAPIKSTTTPPSSSLAAHKDTKKEKDDDAWDIPAFLRRRKR